MVVLVVDEWCGWKKLKHLNERGSSGFGVASPGTLNGLRSRAFFVQEFFFFLLWNWSSYMFVTYRKVKRLLQRRKAFRRFILCILLKLQTKLKWWSNPVPTCPHAHMPIQRCLFKILKHSLEFGFDMVVFTTECRKPTAVECRTACKKEFFFFCFCLPTSVQLYRKYSILPIASKHGCKSVKCVLQCKKSNPIKLPNYFSKWPRKKKEEQIGLIPKNELVWCRNEQIRQRKMPQNFRSKN